MQRSEREFLANKCRVALEQNGITLKIVRNYSEAQEIMAELGKETIGPALDANSLLLTERNSRFIFAFDSDVPLLGFGMRLDDWGDEDTNSFLKRSIEVIFGVRVLSTKHDIFSGTRWGRAVYMGDLKSSSINSLNPMHAKVLRLTFAYAQHLAFSEMLADVTYCFLRAKDARKAITYGFYEVDPFVWTTNQSLYSDGNPDWVMSLHSEKFPSVLAAISDLSSEWLAVDQKDFAAGGVDAKARPEKVHVNTKLG